MTGYPVFLAAPETSGIKNSRNCTKSIPLYLRDPDRTKRLEDDGNKMINDQISEVDQTFVEWLKSDGSKYLGLWRELSCYL